MNCKEKAKEDFYRIAEERGYTVIGEYVNNGTKVEMTCPKGHAWLITPSNFKTGYGCPFCAQTSPIQAKEKFCNNLLDSGYLLNGRYVNSGTKTEVCCPEGHVYEVTPNKFNGGRRCPKCSNRCSTQAKNQMETLVYKEGYKVMSSYINTMAKITLRCPSNHEWTTTSDRFKRGARCPICRGETPDQAKLRFMELAKSRGETVKGSYQNNRIKVPMMCKEGHDYAVSPSNFKKGKGCPLCAHLGFNRNKTGYLYILRGEEGSIKVGITNTPSVRFNKLGKSTPFSFEIMSLFCGKGADVYACEKVFHRNFKQSGYKGFDGCTEWLQMNTFELNDFLPPLFDLKPYHYQNT